MPARRPFLVALPLLALWPAAAFADQTLSACDTAGEWTGGTVVTALHQQGTGAVRWAIADTTALRRENLNADLSGETALRFWLHSSNTNGSHLLVYLGSENSAYADADYYSKDIAIDWQGWREVTLFFEEFSTSRHPLGWQQIDNVRFLAAGWGLTPDPTLVVHVDDVRALHIDPPVLTAQDLYAALDLTRPALSSVAAAVNASDFPAARTALASYMRARTSPGWFFDPHQVTSLSFDKSAADATVAGTFSIVGTSYTFPGGAVDWGFNATTNNPNAAYSAEWQWQLNRMQFWRELGRATWGTSDAKYAQTFAAHLQSFVDSRPCPPFKNNNIGSSWRTIEAGIRMNTTWPDAWYRFLHAPAFDDAHLETMVKSFLSHGRYLRQFQTGGNWVFHEMGGLFTVGAVFPELREASDWRSFAVSRLMTEMATQYLSDGAQYELTPGYGVICLDYVVSVVQVAGVTGTSAELPAGFTDQLKDADLWLIKMMQPDGKAPNVNDSWEVVVASRIAGSAQLVDDPVVRWAATAGADGTPPTFTSLLLPDSGFAVMRTGWSKDSHYLLFDVGPLGFGHYHQDKLNLILAPYGRTLLFDNGGGNYETSAYRDFGITSFSHNTVLVDGKGQLRAVSKTDRLGAGDPATPAPYFHTESGLDYAHGTYRDAYGAAGNLPAAHQREVLMLKTEPQAVLVVDTLEPTDAQSHAYQARWQLWTPNFGRDAATGLVQTTDAGKANLAVVPLAPATVRADSGVSSPEVLGWDLGHTGGRTPALTVRHDVAGAGMQRFVTLLVPLKAGASASVAATTGLPAGSYGATWTDGTALTVKLDPTGKPGFTLTLTRPGGPTESREISADAFACHDLDGDGYGAPASAACAHAEADCDDADREVHPGAAERCDGADDDCDRVSDEGCACTMGDEQPCYSGPAATKGVGLCHAGTQTCQDGQWGECDGQVVPEKEICGDQLDNDCDDLVDDPDGCALPGVDGGTVLVDAGPVVAPADAGSGLDAGGSGPGPGPVGSGCGCASAGASPAGGLLWALAFATAGARRRRGTRD
ncbi:MAG: heparinase II/III family protein [Myxococcales bacterium]